MKLTSLWIMALTFKNLEGDGKKLTIVNIYAPTNAETTLEEERIEFYENKLTKLLEFLRKDPDRTTLIYGDCNAKICDDYLQKDIRNNNYLDFENSMYEGVLGQHIYNKGTTNQNGELVLNLCKRLELVVVSSFHENCGETHLQRVKKDGVKQDLDYVFSSAKDLNMFTKCSVSKEEAYHYIPYPDHFPTNTVLNVRKPVEPSAEKRKRKRNLKKWNIKQLQVHHKEIDLIYSNCLSVSFAII